MVRKVIAITDTNATATTAANTFTVAMKVLCDCILTLHFLLSKDHQIRAPYEESLGPVHTYKTDCTHKAFKCASQYTYAARYMMYLYVYDF